MNQWHKDFRAMKIDLELTNGDIAKITGLTEGSIRSMTAPSKELSRKLKLAVWVWKKVMLRSFEK